MFTKLELRNEAFRSALERLEARNRSWEIDRIFSNIDGGFPYLQLKNGNGAIWNLGFNFRTMEWESIGTDGEKFKNEDFSHAALSKSISTFAHDFEVRDALAMLEAFFGNSGMPIVFASDCDASEIDEMLDALVNEIASAIDSARSKAEEKES